MTMGAINGATTTTGPRILLLRVCVLLCNLRLTWSLSLSNDQQQPALWSPVPYDDAATTTNPGSVFPTSTEAMIRQAVNAIEYAFVQDGIHRQTIRLPLSDTMYGNKEEGFVADRAIGWQGGPQETLRYLSPLVTSVLKQVSTVPVANNNNNNDNGKVTTAVTTTAMNDGGLPPRISEQILLDFDGSSLMTAENSRGALYDAQALLQPNTDRYYLQTIRTVEAQFSDTPNKATRLFLVVNPAWRDQRSWGLFGGRHAQTHILDRYDVTYAIDQFILRGKKVSLLKNYPHEWSFFVEQKDANTKTETETTAVPLNRWLGTFPERPNYEQMDDLILQHFRK